LIRQVCEFIVRAYGVCHAHDESFQEWNSQAVRIPADLAYERTDIEQKIERDGDGERIRIRLARHSLSGVLSKFAQFSPSFMTEGRGDQEQEQEQEQEGMDTL
jgi:antitoxin VapB